MNDSCLFCKIAQGHIPSHKIYENDKVYAFLDLSPQNEGHILVIPKYHGEKLKDIPDDFLSEIPIAVKKISLAFEKMNGKELEYNVLQNNGSSSGQVVMHTHFHIIPRFEGDGFNLHFAPKQATQEELKAFKDKLVPFIE
ncbi:putative Adenosine 5'-monophosphoramidase HNT1 [Blattamonas nauphoetae]|uniref:Adenosine 5'-monophosphoramidase HNT1 n=1 Tax=Blattamonas nauphoetae TaxID=2049346 RepID=A0ABQ9Y1Q7_9EUKA|nr:putative Adenosine 5'-monophosphoramidase HNT1 [Blattamonas nauphoetae]